MAKVVSRNVVPGLALTISAPVLAQNKDLRVLDAVKQRDKKTVSSLIRAKADFNATQQADGLPVDLAVDLLTKLISGSGIKPKIPSKR